MVRPSPSVFLIKPDSWVIEKKHQVHCDFGNHNLDYVPITLAVKDSVFFIRVGETGVTQITIVAGLGPSQVTRRFDLCTPPMVVW